MLDTQINELKSNLVQCLEAVEPLANVLFPPVKDPALPDINQIINLFPSTAIMDPIALQAEITKLFEHLEMKGLKLGSIAEMARFTKEWKNIFPLSTKLSGYCLQHLSVLLQMKERSVA